MGYLPGDCLMAAAFMSYMGPFLSSYRDEIVEKNWLPEVRVVPLYVFIVSYHDFLQKR